MLKIEHPATIVRDREKRVNQWETVRTYRYSNGAELQILIGSLPHGHVQSALSSNRVVKLELDGKDGRLVFSDEAAPIVDFLNGDRPTAETSNTLVLDACHFVHSDQIEVVHGDEVGELVEEGHNKKAVFKDGTTVALLGHGGHAHVEAKKDEKGVKTFFNGKENKLFVFGPFN